ncbi:unnamed protein product [Rotaria socialis]|uniref:Uncharacterized protein n=2 Tax=Rotaria socialis TaxID=392032 RepID=A0A821RFG7_9BILA|nr:unnamed protein product [Rotaria socialis]CAF4840097.1 unnamed protein product [Rotaria socialis]
MDLILGQVHNIPLIVANGYSNTSWEDYLNGANVVLAPCIEPHCEIECMTLYPDFTSKQNLDTYSLSEEERQHISIDAGTDKLVNDMINEYPVPKICPYRASDITSEQQPTNTTVEYFPLAFGFNEHYLFNTNPTKVSFNRNVMYVNQMCLPKKSKDFSDLLPGRGETYGFRFGEELEYRRIYSSVYYAITMMKGGWDCNRHYEILSSGTMPYFDDLENAGSFMLVHLPKTLLLEARAIIGVRRDHMKIDHRQFNLTQYRLLLHRVLYYTKYRLTTRKLAEYILKTIHYPRSINHSVLLIAHQVPDYMKELMLHGFTQIFGSSLHVYNSPRYLYSYPKHKQWTFNNTKEYYAEELYGFGYGYALSLRKYAKLHERDKRDLTNETVVENIKNNRYTLIIFGSILRSNHLFPLVARHYYKSRIVVIDGEDKLKSIKRSEYARLASYFLREIPDKCGDFT